MNPFISHVSAKIVAFQQKESVSRLFQAYAYPYLSREARIRLIERTQKALNATPPDAYCDPILLNVMSDPVSTERGHSYERSSIETVFEKERQRFHSQKRSLIQKLLNIKPSPCFKDPKTNLPISDRLIPNVNLRSRILEYQENHIKELLSLAKEWLPYFNFKDINRLIFFAKEFIESLRYQQPYSRELDEIKEQLQIAQNKSKSPQTITYPDGSVYKGYITCGAEYSGKRHGEGTLEFNTNPPVHYRAYWKSDQPKQGVFFFLNPSYRNISITNHGIQTESLAKPATFTLSHEKDVVTGYPKKEMSIQKLQPLLQFIMDKDYFKGVESQIFQLLQSLNGFKPIKPVSSGSLESTPSETDSVPSETKSLHREAEEESASDRESRVVQWDGGSLYQDAVSDLDHMSLDVQFDPNSPQKSLDSFVALPNALHPNPNPQQAIPRPLIEVSFV